MKTKALVLLFFCTSFLTVFALDPIKKTPVIKPAALPQSIPTKNNPIFTVSFYDNFISIVGSGYLGTVDVYIIGENGVSTTFTMDGTLNESIDTSSLESGSYTLIILTDIGLVVESSFER